MILKRIRARLGARAFTLIEALVASAVLLLSLCGVLYLLGQTPLLGRDADLWQQAAEYGAQTVGEYEAMGYTGLVDGTYTGTRADLARLTTTTTVVKDTTNFTAAVNVVVSWTDTHGKAQTRVFNGVVSRSPAEGDAG